MKICMKSLTPRVVFLILISLLGGMAFSQARVSDKDVQKMMKNLNEDAKKFKSNFNSTVGKSEIRRTSREKESKQLVAAFEKQTDGLLKKFKRDRKADDAMRVVLASAGKISDLLGEVSLPKKTTDSWQKVQGELDMLARALSLE